MLFQTAPLPGTTRVHVTVVRAKGVRNLKNLTLLGWLIYSGGVKCFYREYKCLIFKVKELNGIEFAFVKE